MKLKRFLKKPITPEIVDDIRINLSVKAEKLSPEPVCDICGDPSPIVVYAAMRTSLGKYKPCWRWCACSGCEKLLDANDWDAVVKKIVERMNELTVNAFSEKMIETAAKSALAEFTTYAITLEGRDELEKL